MYFLKRLFFQEFELYLVIFLTKFNNSIKVGSFFCLIFIKSISDNHIIMYFINYYISI